MPPAIARLGAIRGRDPPGAAMLERNDLPCRNSRGCSSAPGPDAERRIVAGPRWTFPVRSFCRLDGPGPPGQYHAVHFGVFVEELRHGATQASAFRDIFETADRAEASGIDCVWLGEIHFTPTRSIISASLQVASAIAARTRRLRVGTAVQVLPLNHPLRIAEEVATVDQISEGRFEFGVGRSGVVRTYDTYGVRYDESQARFREALDIVRRAWTGEPFSYEGEFYRIRDATVAPRPYQVPHPPIRMAATSDETFPAAGRLGLPIFVGLRSTEISDLQAQLAPYREAWREADHPGEPSVYLRIPVYASPTARGAAEEPRESLTSFFARQTELARSAVGRAGAGPPDRRRMQAERMAALSYEDMLDRKVAFGTAAAIVDRLTELREQLQLDGVVAELNPGGRIPPELETRSLQILARDVLPALKR
jgi:alkanesulfonate monooxygenase SsuD/methylene tetrahydromethanopterin reductase-like flavin-dependent oxidoreductase (luciferase family)